MTREEFLFHGSRTGGINVLEPRISLEYKKLVYATDDLAYALIRAGKQLGMIREEYYGKSRPIELAECYPDAFNQMFNCCGYVYLLNRNDFVRNPDNALEYVSDTPVKVQGCIPVDCILDAMKALHLRYDFHMFYDEEYWKNVRGGLEGFIERKKYRKRKMMETV